MKLISGIHFALMLIIATILVTNSSTRSAIGYLIGAALIYLNALVLATAWNLIFKKKLVALSVSLIVFKYAILGIITYYVVRHIQDQLFWFAMGIFSFIVPATAYAIIHSYSKRGKDV